MPIVLLLGWIVALAFEAPATAAPAIVSSWSVCNKPPWVRSALCIPKPLHDVDPQGRMLWLTANVRLDGRTTEPAGVFVSAYASSAAYWDDRLIGMNGVPTERPEREKAGLRDTTFSVPDATSGDHRLTLQMSSHNGILRLRSPVTQVSLGPFERPSSKVMRDYVPALVSAGALLIMVIIFAFVMWGAQQRASSTYLLGAALAATGQLVAEASRAFLDLPYPMLFVRIALVLAFAAGFGFMLLAYLARRFEVAKTWPVLLIQALFAAVAIFLVPSFDQRTGLVLASAMAIGMLLAIRAAMRSAPGARPLVAMLALGLVVSLTQPYSFLDRDLYPWTAGLFLLLFAGEARRLKRSFLAAGGQLSPSSPKPVPVGISLGTAAGRHFVLPSDIVRLAAADDYTEVFLIGARTVLHPEPLQRLLERLPADFLRVHRSHAINLSHLRSFKKGRNSAVVLSDDSTAPVSRRSVSNLVAALEG